MTHRYLPAAVRALVAGAALAAAMPAFAQQYYPPPPPPAPHLDYADDIVVYSPYRRLPDDVDTLSQRVGYGDLDLYYADDRRELRRRVSLTARDLCERLGESNSGTIGTSCRDDATRSALRRVGTPAEEWAPRGTAWVAPPRWRQPRYPATWVPRDPCGCR